MDTSFLTPAQCRAARAYLSWSQKELAERAQISRSAIETFECGKSRGQLMTLQRIKKAFEQAGLRLLDSGGLLPVRDKQGT